MPFVPSQKSHQLCNLSGKPPPNTSSTPGWAHSVAPLLLSAHTVGGEQVRNTSVVLPPCSKHPAWLPQLASYLLSLWIIEACSSGVMKCGSATPESGVQGWTEVNEGQRGAAEKDQNKPRKTVLKGPRGGHPESPHFQFEESVLLIEVSVWHTGFNLSASKAIFFSGS